MMSCFICWIRGHDNAIIFHRWQSHLTSYKEKFRSNQGPIWSKNLILCGSKSRKLLRRCCSTASSRERRVKLSTPHWTKISPITSGWISKGIVDFSVLFSRTHFDWILGHYDKQKINRKRSQNMSFLQDMYTWLQKFYKVKVHTLLATHMVGSFFKQDVTLKELKFSF